MISGWGRVVRAWGMFGHVPLFKTIGMSHIRRSSIFFPTPMKLKIREAPVYKRKITYPTNFSLEKKQPPCKFHTPFSHAISVCLLKKKMAPFFLLSLQGATPTAPNRPQTFTTQTFTPNASSMPILGDLGLRGLAKGSWVVGSPNRPRSHEVGPPRLRSLWL